MDHNEKQRGNDPHQKKKKNYSFNHTCYEHQVLDKMPKREFWSKILEFGAKLHTDLPELCYKHRSKAMEK